MANMCLTFEDVYKSVSKFIGWGASPTGTDATNAKAVVIRGYRRFLHPINLQTGRAHTWSFLKKSAVLVTESDKWVYNLPTDFDKLSMPFRHEADSGYPGLIYVSEDKIIRCRASAATTSYPHFFAIKPGIYIKEIGTTYEVIFFETPNSAYPLVYSYIINPPKLVEDDDIFIGGDFASEVILESALSVSEQEYDEVRGLHTEIATELTQQLIQADTSTIPDTLGKNYDTNIRYVEFQRSLPLTETDSIY